MTSLTHKTLYIDSSILSGPLDIVIEKLKELYEEHKEHNPSLEVDASESYGSLDVEARLLWSRPETPEETTEREKYEQKQKDRRRQRLLDELKKLEGGS